MQPKFYYSTSLLVIVFCVVLVLFARNSTPEGVNPLVISTSDALDAQMEPTKDQAYIDALSVATEEPTVSLEAPVQDGTSLLNSHCAQCHKPSWLKQIKKNRSGWEKTLLKMEKYDVSLSDSEKTILLDTLTAISAR